MSFLTPLDLLAVPDAEQDIIRCLVRRPRMTGPEISTRVNMPLEKVAAILQKMVGDARLSEQTQDGQTHFSVQFEKGGDSRPSGNGGAEKRRGAASLLDSLFP